MLRNLRAEMARKGLSGKTIASKIGITDRAFRNKLTGRSEFTRAEMCKIKGFFFNDLTFEYLFELTGLNEKSA